jgi:hypothetical protein
MAGTVHNPGQEFWQRPLPQAETAPAPSVLAACQDCGAEFIIGSRYCHACGAKRSSGTLPLRLLRRFEFAYISNSLGLGTASLVAFLAGLTCLLGALLTGFIFSAASTLDWQAIQLWRIQWLLAAVGSFTAGILLKKTS